MSAIGAIFAPGGVRPDHVQAMAASLGEIPHDQAGHWQRGPMALVAAIQHTTAEERDQDQPCTSADGRVAIVFDGYLLNARDLVDDLEARGERPANRSDAAIALAAYQTWGDACADRFQGEFSLIVADARAGRLFVARDHLGFVPLFYRQEGDRLIIASDLRTILQLGETQPEPDPLYLAQVMSNRWYTREATAWKPIKRVLRAHTLRFDGERLTMQRYWEPPTDITIRYKDDAQYVEHYREVLFDCVARASRSDRTVGVAVSGGLDSSAIFCIADRLEKEGRWQSPGFAGYSLAAGEDGNAFELPYARAAARHIGREITEVPLFDPDIEWYAKDGAWHRDLPIPSNGAMMLDMERQVVEDGSRVLINGSGGDEWLQGNSQYYREYVADLDARGFLRALRRDASALGWGSALKQAGRQAAAELTPGPLRELVRERLRERRRRGERAPLWLKPELRQMLAEAEEEYEATLPRHGVLLAKHNLVKSPFSDLTNSMMRRQRARIGLQSRHPMLSRAFIEFSLRTPGDIKLRGGIKKAVHRQAMAGILPSVILERTTKANFTNVRIDCQFADYVQAHAADYLDQLCDSQGLQRVLDIDFASPEGDYWAWEIWGLYASAAFLYQHQQVTEINPASGVQQDRN